MAYQLFYGNPFVPGVGQSLVEGARKKEDFARRIQNTKLRLEARALDIEQAKLDATKTANEIDQERQAKARRPRGNTSTNRPNTGSGVTTSTARRNNSASGRNRRRATASTSTRASPPRMPTARR